jgi:hypothetical protein
MSADELRGLCAHECFHAVDGVVKKGTGSNRLSGRSEKGAWRYAWEAEINNEDHMLLSDYAKISAKEGFAEFGRHILEEPRDAKAWFPKCFQVFVDNGLVTAARKKSASRAPVNLTSAHEHSRWVKGAWWAEEPKNSLGMSMDDGQVQGVHVAAGGEDVLVRGWRGST